MLDNRDNDRSELCANDQVSTARAAGYQEVILRVEGPSRADARLAWDSQRSSRPHPYSQEMDGDHRLEPLNEAELDPVVRFVRALVSRER